MKEQAGRRREPEDHVGAPVVVIEERGEKTRIGRVACAEIDVSRQQFLHGPESGDHQAIARTQGHQEAQPAPAVRHQQDVEGGEVDRGVEPQFLQGPVGEDAARPAGAGGAEMHENGFAFDGHGPGARIEGAGHDQNDEQQPGQQPPQPPSHRPSASAALKQHGDGDEYPQTGPNGERGAHPPDVATIQPARPKQQPGQVQEGHFLQGGERMRTGLVGRHCDGRS